MCSFDFVFYFLLSFQQGTSQILTGLIFHPLFPGAILPTSQANPDAQNGILPAGQAGANPASQGTPEDPFSTPSGTDDDFAATTPAGIQRGRPTTEETPTGSPKGGFSKPGRHPGPWTSSVEWERRVLCLALTNTDPNSIREPLYSLTFDSSNKGIFFQDYYPYWGFPDSSVDKESTCNAGDPSLIPGSGRYTGEGIDYPLHYSWASYWTYPKRKHLIADIIYFPCWVRAENIWNQMVRSLSHPPYTPSNTHRTQLINQDTLSRSLIMDETQDLPNIRWQAALSNRLELAQ